MTFVQRRPSVEDVGPTLYIFYTIFLCLLGSVLTLEVFIVIFHSFKAGIFAHAIPGLKWQHNRPNSLIPILKNKIVHWLIIPYAPKVYFRLVLTVSWNRPIYISVKGGPRTEKVNVSNKDETLWHIITIVSYHKFIFTLSGGSSIWRTRRTPPPPLLVKIWNFHVFFLIKWS